MLCIIILHKLFLLRATSTSNVYPGHSRFTQQCYGKFNIVTTICDHDCKFMKYCLQEYSCVFHAYFTPSVALLVSDL